MREQDTFRGLCTALCVLLLTLVSPSRTQAETLPDLSVDLHAHVFMKPGLGWFFTGSFGEDLAADSWDDRLSSRVNAKTLDASGVGIMVVAMFAHPLYRGDVRAAVREQIAAARAFAKKSPIWEIAKSPQEAERLLRSGKRALVLSLEGAGSVLESEEDLKEFIDEAGVRIVTPLHLVDDRFGGVATLNGFQYLANPLNLVDQLLDAHCDDGLETNRQGLTPLGKKLAVELAKRGVWLDLTHASDASLKSLVPIAEAAGQPLLFTHTTLRAYRPTERALSQQMLRRVAKSGGLVGLLPSDDALETIVTAPAFCPAGCSVEQCKRGMPAFATMYQVVGSAVGFDHVMLGSDFNGGMRHLPASCGTKTELDQPAGFYHVGQTRQVWETLKALGTQVPPMRMTARAFLDTWAKVQPTTVAHDALPDLPARDDIEGPGWMLTLGAGLSTTPHGEMPGVVVRLDSRFSKDTSMPTALEPVLYFAHLDADAALSPDEEDAPYARVALSAMGVRAAWLDNHAQAEAIRGLLRRNVALDQKYTLTLSALGGRVRTMPGLLKWPGQFNLFLEIGIDLLGYDFLRHQSQRSDLHGVYLAGGDLGLGLSAYPGQAIVSLQGSLAAEISAITSLPVDGFAYQSDIAGGGALVFATRDGVFRQQLSVMRYLNVESDLDAPKGDTQVRGTFAVSF